MLLNRPIIYYVPDLDEFIANCRGMLFDLRDIAVGPVCEDFPALLQAIDALGDPHNEDLQDSKQRDRVMQRLHEHRDAQACRRVLDELANSFPEAVSAIAGGGKETMGRTT
jgi:CDP-glycerol glycerophosphotransferase